MNPTETDLHKMNLTETPPAPLLADQFSLSRYDGSALMPAGAVCSLQRGPDGCFVGLGRCQAVRYQFAQGYVSDCKRQIGTIGYRLVAGGPVLCWGCYVQAMRGTK